MPTVLCLKAYFVKSDLAMYDEDQVAASSQIIRTRRPMFGCCIIWWIVWLSSSINTDFSYKYLKHPGHIISTIGSRQSGKNEHESCAKTLIQSSMPAGCQVWLPIPSLLSLLFLSFPPTIQLVCKMTYCEENGCFRGINFPWWIYL